QGGHPGIDGLPRHETRGEAAGQPVATDESEDARLLAEPQQAGAEHQVRGARCRVLGIELRVSLRLTAQDVARCEARAVPLGEPLELAHNPRCAEIVPMPERATPERRDGEPRAGADLTA